MCEFARNCSKLRQLTTTSTAYVQPHIEGPIYEELVKLPCDAISLLDGIESGQITEEDALEITGHPNTYTLTKCLAEHIIMGYETVLPLTIVRPSIISASRCFPVPGWIDSHAAFAGFIAAFGLGILHVVDGNVNGRGDIVPVDDVARQLIDTTLKLGNVSKDSRIVYAVAGWQNSVPWRACVSTITEFFNGKPPGPGGKAKLNNFGPRNLMYHFHDIVRQKIPFAVSKWHFGVVGDTKMRSKTAKIANLVESINKVFPYFVHHSFDFRPRNDLLGNLNCENYVRSVCTGVERYLLRKGEKL